MEKNCMKQYKTMFTKDYVLDWSVADGIREFVANALDSSAQFEYSINGGEVSLTSKGIQLPSSVLTLGTSIHRNDQNAVGTHGEGILVGIIPILRDGGVVVFNNGSVQWIPEFVYDDDFGKELLVISENDRGNDGDYTVNISTRPEYVQEVVDRCLYLQDDLGEIKEGTRGRVLLDRPGKLYVGGLYVCDINGHKFSYDFHPRYLPLNRDRKSVDSWNLGENTSILLHEVFPAEKVAELIEERSADIRYSQYHSHAAPNPQEVYNACYHSVVEKHGDDVVVVNDWDEKEKLENRGFENVIVLSSDNQYTNVIRSKLYQERFSELEQEADEEEEEKSPVEWLEEWYNNEGYNVDERWSRFEDLLDLFKERGVQWGGNRPCADT